MHSQRIGGFGLSNTVLAGMEWLTSFTRSSAVANTPPDACARPCNVFVVLRRVRNSRTIIIIINVLCCVGKSCPLVIGCDLLARFSDFYLPLSHLTPSVRGSPRAIGFAKSGTPGFIFGVGKLEWLDYDLVKVAWWLTHCVGRQKFVITWAYKLLSAVTTCLFWLTIERNSGASFMQHKITRTVFRHCVMSWPGTRSKFIGVNNNKVCFLSSACHCNATERNYYVKRFHKLRKARKHYVIGTVSFRVSARESVPLLWFPTSQVTLWLKPLCVQSTIQTVHKIVVTNVL